MATSSPPWPTTLPVLLTASLWLGPTPAVAQVLGGALRDSITGEPVAAATVILLSEAGPAVSVTTGRDGAFRLVAPTGGTYRVQIEAIGYRPMTSEPFQLGTYQTQSVTISVVPLATRLDPVEGTAEAFRPPRLREFDQRREQGNGSFITRAEIERHGNPTRLTQVLQRMQGIRVRPNPAYQKGEGLNQDTRRWLIEMGSRGPRSFTRSGAAGAAECAPLVFLDGRYLGDTRIVDVDAILAMMEVVAIEAFWSAASMPASYNRPGAGCGVIGIWSG